MAKKVFYICKDINYPITTTINDFFTVLQNDGFVYMKSDKGNFTKEKNIYYDNINHREFSKSLSFYGGFLRQFIDVTDENKPEFFVDYKPNASHETKRYAVNQFATSKEIEKAVNYRGKIVPLFTLDCDVMRSKFQKRFTSGLGMSFEITLQRVKVDSSVEKPFDVYFICLNDKTKKDFGFNSHDQLEPQIQEVFKKFQMYMIPFEQIFNKYKAVLDILNEDELSKVAPF